MKSKRIAFINGKGGCGKTTSIFHVAGVLAHRGEKVLVVDLDKQRNTTDIMLMDSVKTHDLTVLDYMQKRATIDNVINQASFKNRSNAVAKYCNVDVISADVLLEDEKQLKNVDIKESFNKFVGEQGYTWVLIDMPPSNKMLNEICFSQMVEYVIVPFSSDIFSVSGYGDLMETINKAREFNADLKILGIYLSRFMENCAVDKFILSQLKQFGEMFLDIQIPLRADIREAVMFGRPLSYYKINSTSLSAYKKLVGAIEEKIKYFN
ncbi:MAG: ParA family protein [Oscillospiraceae bacterium]